MYPSLPQIPNPQPLNFRRRDLLPRRNPNLPSPAQPRAHRTLSLLFDLASRHPHLSGLVSRSVVSNSILSTESTRVAGESLASISEHDAVEGSDDRLFASLCFSDASWTRPCLIRNAGRLGVRPYTCLSLFLGFTMDPYPDMRISALCGLFNLSGISVIDDGDTIRGCYFRAGELLRTLLGLPRYEQ